MSTLLRDVLGFSPNTTIASPFRYYLVNKTRGWVLDAGRLYNNYSLEPWGSVSIPENVFPATAIQLQFGFTTIVKNDAISFDPLRSSNSSSSRSSRSSSSSSSKSSNSSTSSDCEGATNRCLITKPCNPCGAYSVVCISSSSSSRSSRWAFPLTEQDGNLALCFNGVFFFNCPSSSTSSQSSYSSLSSECNQRIYLEVEADDNTINGSYVLSMGGMNSNYWYLQLKDIKVNTAAFNINSDFIKRPYVNNKFEYPDSNCKNINTFLNQTNNCLPSFFRTTLSEAFPSNPCNFDKDSTKVNSNFRVYSKTKKYINIPIEEIVNTPDEFGLSWEENDFGGSFYNSKELECCNSPVIEGQDSKFVIELIKINRRQCSSSSSSRSSFSSSKSSSNSSSRTSSCFDTFPQDVLILTISGVTGCSGVNGTWNLSNGPTGGWSIGTSNNRDWVLTNTNPCCNYKNAVASITCISSASSAPFAGIPKFASFDEEKIEQNFENWFNLNVDLDTKENLSNDSLFSCAPNTEIGSSTSLKFGTESDFGSEISRADRNNNCCEDEFYHELLVYFEVKGIRILVFRDDFKINPSPPLIGKITLSNKLNGSLSQLSLDKDDPLFIAYFNEAVHPNFPRFFLCRESDKTNYIYDGGSGGQAVLWPCSQDPDTINISKLNNYLNYKYRDHVGMFERDGAAFYKTNFPNLYDGCYEGGQYFINNCNYGNIDTVALEGITYTKVAPIILVHNSITSHVADHDIFFNVPIKPVKTSDGYSLGHIPISVYSITANPIDESYKDDIYKDKWPKERAEENLFQGVVINNNNIRSSADFNKSNTERGMSKYLYCSLDYCQSANINTITKKISKDGYEDSPRVVSVTNFNSGFIGYNNLTSDVVKLSSLPENGIVYVSGIFASRRHFRQITQTHIGVPNDKLAYTSGPFGYGQYLTKKSFSPSPSYAANTYASMQPIFQTESFIFSLSQPKSKSGETHKGFDTWRLSEMCSDGWFFYKKWLKNHPDDNSAPLYTPNFDIIDQSNDGGGIYPNGADKWEALCYSADSEGIKLIYINCLGKTKSEILLEKEKIRDQKWFNLYLKNNYLENKILEEELDFSDFSHRNEEGELVTTNYRFIFSRSFTSGMLFDMSSTTNSNFDDHDKIPYTRDFAAALMQVSKYDANNKDSGVGIELLDFKFNDKKIDIVEKKTFSKIKNRCECEDATNEYAANSENKEKSSATTSIVNDLSYAYFIPKAKYSLTSFSTRDINNNLATYSTSFFRNQTALLGLFKTVKVSELGSEWTSSNSTDELLEHIETIGKETEIDATNNIKQFYTNTDANLPPGQYKIKYLRGDTADPDNECCKMYLRYNSMSPCMFVDEEAPNVNNTEVVINHFGGPIGIVSQQGRGLRFGDSSCLLIGNSLDFKDGSGKRPMKTPRYLIEPISLYKSSIGQTLDLEYSGIKYIVQPTPVSTKLMNNSTRVYIESVALTRQNEDKFTFEAEILDKAGIYPDMLVEYANLITSNYVPLKYGDIAISTNSYRENVSIFNTLPNGAVTLFDNIDTKEGNSWRRNGINIDKAITKYKNNIINNLEKCKNENTLVCPRVNASSRSSSSSSSKNTCSENCNYDLIKREQYDKYIKYNVSMSPYLYGAFIPYMFDANELMKVGTFNKSGKEINSIDGAILKGLESKEEVYREDKVLNYKDSGNGKV